MINTVDTPAQIADKVSSITGIAILGTFLLILIAAAQIYSILFKDNDRGRDRDFDDRKRRRDRRR